VGCQLLSKGQHHGAGAVLDGGQEAVHLTEEHGKARLGVRDDLVLLVAGQVLPRRCVEASQVH
jgi:hypothetical protein